MSKAVDSKLRQLLQRGGEAEPGQALDAIRGPANERGLAWCV